MALLGSELSRAVPAISAGAVRGGKPVGAAGARAAVGGPSCPGPASAAPPDNCSVCHVEYSLVRCKCEAFYCAVDWEYHQRRCLWVKHLWNGNRPPAPPSVPSLSSSERRALRRLTEREGKSSGALSDSSGSPSTDAASTTPSSSTTVGRGAGRQKKNTHLSKW